MSQPPSPNFCDSISSAMIRITAGKKNVNILVNLKECMFHFYKPGETQHTRYEHHQLLQLMKSHSTDTRLTIVFKGQGRKEYIFNDMRVRTVYMCNSRKGVWGQGYIHVHMYDIIIR